MIRLLELELVIGWLNIKEIMKLKHGLMAETKQQLGTKLFITVNDFSQPRQAYVWILFNIYSIRLVSHMEPQTLPFLKKLNDWFYLSTDVWLKYLAVVKWFEFFLFESCPYIRMCLDRWLRFFVVEDVQIFFYWGLGEILSLDTFGICYDEVIL